MNMKRSNEMDYTLLNIVSDDMPTKRRIMIYSLELFNRKGYSETTTRHIASAVGITSGSIYGHFSSKEEILEYMLKDYGEYTKGMYETLDTESILRKKPTGEGVGECLMSSISILSKDIYYANLVHLVHQEQHRNPLFGAFVLLRLQETKDYVKKIFDILKEMNIIKEDANDECWGVVTYSLMHTLSSCLAISIRQQKQSYSMADMGAMLRYIFDTAIAAHKKEG